MPIFYSIISRLFSAAGSPSFLGAFQFLSYIWRLIVNFFSWILNLILQFAWVIIKFVLGVMEAFEYILNEMLGIGGDPTGFLEIFTSSKSNDIAFVNVVVKTFKAILVVAIVLMLIFTIYAIIKQEIRNVQNGFENSSGEGNSKKGMVLRILKSLGGMILLPLVMVFIMTGINAILTSFNNALKGPTGSTVASQVLASSTYDSNRYRTYAKADRRIPIVIHAYNPEEYNIDQTSELIYKIKSAPVQDSLLKTAVAISENNLLTFADSLSYKNNKLINSTNYDSIYESFICTPEQYQVMADFIDYAEMTGINYYIKAMDEKDIDWKYVESTQYSKNDNSLTIKYKDASDINKNGSTSDTYEITYKMSYDVTSPISDALDSIMAILGLGDYKDYLYKVMERDEDYINLVNWSNEKVLIKFSEQFDATNPQTWTHSDQIIIYEFYHFSSNNTFAKYTLSDIKKGIELDSLKICYREYYPEAGAYSPEREISGVLINGTYYNTVKSTSERDSFGNFYYVLKTFEDVEFINNLYTTIAKVENAKTVLKLSSGFDLNVPDTWTYVDQILVYEYYKDLSYTNSLRNHIFSDYEFNKGGIDIPVYEITRDYIDDKNGTYQKSSAKYALINGTYYEVSEQTAGEYSLKAGAPGTKFLDKSPSDAYIVYDYDIKFNGTDWSVDKNITGIDGNDNGCSLDSSPNKGASANTFIYEWLPATKENELNNEEIEKYGHFKLQFSTLFDYKDPSTWTYRDYFLFYLFTKYPGIANSLEEIKHISLTGELCKVNDSVKSVSKNEAVNPNNRVMFRVEYPNADGTLIPIYLDVDGVNMISELTMTQKVHNEIAVDTSVNGNNLFIDYIEGSDLYNAETEVLNFKFSEGFSLNRPDSWTVSDMLIVALSEKGYIAPIDNIIELEEEYTYNALVYCIKNGDTTDRYYKFGKGSSGENVIYLSEKNVLNLRLFNSTTETTKFDNIQEWLNMSVLSFISRAYGINSSNFITDYDGIVNDLYMGVSHNVYSIGQIIEKLVKENGLIAGVGDAFKVFDDISMYKYKNQNFNYYDISTWTSLDAVIFYLTGKCSGEYNSYIISLGGKNYFKIDDYAVNISDGKFESELRETNMIRSAEVTDYSSADGWLNYVKNHYQIKDSASEPDYAGKKNILFTENYFIDENGNSKLSYYSSSKFSYTPSSITSTNHEALSIILRAYLGNDLAPYYDFNLFTDGVDKYICIETNSGDKYYCLVGSLGSNNPVTYSEQSELALKLANTSSIFEKNGTYTSFQNVNLNNLSANKFNYIDSVIYYFSGNIESATYDIYTTKVSGSAVAKSYISINDISGKRMFIEFKRSDTTLESISTKSPDFGSIEYLNKLYKDYYSKYVTIPGAIDESESSPDATYSLTMSENDIETWTALGIVLKGLNLINADGTEETVTGKIVNSLNGETYFEIYDTNTGRPHYIILDGICEYNQGTKSVVDISSANIELFYKLFLYKNGENNIGSFVQNEYITFNQNLGTILSTATTVKKGSENYSTDIGVANDLTDTSNWTWFELLYYKFFGRFRSTESKFEYYTNKDGQKFIKLYLLTGGYKYILETDILMLSPNDSRISSNAIGSIDYKFDLNSSEKFTNLGLIAYKHTANQIGNVSYIKMPTKVQNNTDYSYTSELYIVTSAALDNNYIVYGLDNKELEVNVSKTTLDLQTSQKDDLFTWTALDYIIKYTSGSSESNVLNTKVYNFGDSQYIKNGENYINITILGLTFVETYDKNDQDKVVSYSLTTHDNKDYKNMPKLLTLSTNNTNIGIFNKFDNGFKNVPVLEASVADKDSSLDQNIIFSEGFVANDPNTWKVSDFIIYSNFQSGKFKNITNFQEFVNQGYVNGYIRYFVYEDSYGNATVCKVLLFDTDTSNMKNGDEIIIFDLFKQLYGRDLREFRIDTSLNSITNNVVIDYNVKTEPSIKDYSVTINKLFIANKAELVANNFGYDNYYFYKVDSEVLNNSELKTGVDAYVTALEKGEGKNVGTINLKLSNDFDLNNPNNWTVLDFIIIFEASRSVNDNAFKNQLLNDLKNNNNRIDVLTVGDSGKRFLYINGSFYDITNYIERDEFNNEVKDESNDFVISELINNIKVNVETNGNTEEKSGIVTKGSVDDYYFKFLAEKTNFILQLGGYIKKLDFKTPTTFSYTLEPPQNGLKVETEYYYTVDTRVSMNFQIVLSDTSKYPPETLTISPMVRKVNWPQKLMNDMMVIYPDLNWETLIATSGWIDTLGDFSSSNTTGTFETEGNSANITAAGLVLSEFFLSIAKEQEFSYANYSYESIFDEKVIKSLMLSLMGEENYKALCTQAKVFSEMFNISFAPILDDIAAENGIKIVDGKIDNFTISVYKAYLSTIFLSSDFGEYLYKIATRVYSQYTIFESLAYAGGDYSRYYAFFNGLEDENGEKVNSFTYGTFQDLVKYENQAIGNGTPTFTFNYAKVYKKYFNENASKQEIQASLNNDYSSLYFKYSFETVSSKLLDEYNMVYNNTGNNKISDNADNYCFLYEVYYSTVNTLNKRGIKFKDHPAYMNLYKSYLVGNITRWGVLNGLDAAASTKQIKNYNLYNLQLTLSKFSLLSAIIPLYKPEVDFNFEANEENLEDAISFAEGVVDAFELTAPYAVLKETFAESSEYSDIVERILGADPLTLFKLADTASNTNNKYSSSEMLSAWNTIVRLNNDIEKLLAELDAVRQLGKGVKNFNGSIRLDYSDSIYEGTYEALKKVYATVGSYISIQTTLDKITKSSITFMLAQYGQNYVAEGFKFSLENRDYTLTTTSSATRIAEYVYGGAWLQKFGVEPVYTNKDDEGIMEAIMVYDHTLGMIKTKLISFPELRGFVSSIADYTAKLYYLTNFNDLSDNISDTIMLTDYIYANHPIDSSHKIKVTPEFLILSHLILREDVSADTLLALIMGDGTRELSNLGILDNPNYASISNLAKYLENDASVSNLSEDSKKQGLIDYLLLIMSDEYTSFGYYSQNNNQANERIHLVFKNVISYFITSEDAADTYYENAAKLDGINFKELRCLLMEKLADYVENNNETAAENATRYITLFNLINSQFTYYKNVDSSDLNEIRIGRTIAYEHRTDKDELGNLTDTPEYDGNYSLFAIFSIDASSRNSVLTLAGIANRPIEELVNLEYDSLYDLNGNYDEAKGDSFVLCTYDEETAMYVPIMARNQDGGSFSTDSAYAKFVSRYGIKCYTHSYDVADGNAVAQPIIAKGLITADYKPTAIKMVNHKVSFYRTDITATGQVNEDAITVTSVVQETQTIGFVKFVDRATSKKLSDSHDQQIMFMGQANMTGFLSSDVSAYYLQVTNAYNCSIDEQNKFNVLDTFSYYYRLGMMEIFMLCLGFATIFPLLFKASIAAMQRILDLIFLTLIGPLAISMNSLNIDDGSGKSDNNAFSNWRNYMTQSIMQAFGLIIGFNIYYILVSTITNMTFVSDFTVQKIQDLGGMTIISSSMLNMVVKFLFLITASGLIQIAGNLVTSIITTGKVKDAFTSSVSGNALGNIKEGFNKAKGVLDTMKSAMTGQLLLEAKDAAIQSVKNAIPGSAIGAHAVNFAKNRHTHHKAKSMQKALINKGIGKDVAAKAAKQFESQIKSQRAQKRKNQINNANKFMGRAGLNDLKFSDPLDSPKPEKAEKNSKDSKKKLNKKPTKDKKKDKK